MFTCRTKGRAKIPLCGVFAALLLPVLAAPAAAVPVYVQLENVSTTGSNVGDFGSSAIIRFGYDTAAPGKASGVGARLYALDFLSVKTGTMDAKASGASILFQDRPPPTGSGVRIDTASYGGSFDDPGISAISLYLRDATGAALDGSAPPLVFDPGAYSGRTVSFRTSTGNTVSYNVTGSQAAFGVEPDWMRPPAPPQPPQPPVGGSGSSGGGSGSSAGSGGGTEVISIPEPGTVFLLGSGLLGLGLVSFGMKAYRRSTETYRRPSRGWARGWAGSR